MAIPGILLLEVITYRLCFDEGDAHAEVWRYEPDSFFGGGWGVTMVGCVLYLEWEWSEY